MMNKFVYFLSGVLTVLLASAPVEATTQNSDGGVFFDSIPFASACQKAKEENKLVFLDCYVKSCGPCRMMERKVFPQKVCGDYFNKRFVSLKLDMDEGEGPELRKRYGVMIYPTFLFINHDGSTVLKYEAGAEKDAECFVSKIESAMKAMAMYDKYSAGCRDVAFIGDLISRFLKFDSRKAREVADDCLADAPADVFCDSVIWDVLPKTFNRTDCPAFRRMFDMRHEIASLKGRDIVLETLVKIYSDEFSCRNQEWYDCGRRIEDLKLLCAEDAPGAESLHDRMLVFCQGR